MDKRFALRLTESHLEALSLLSNSGSALVRSLVEGEVERRGGRRCLEDMLAAGTDEEAAEWAYSWGPSLGEGAVCPGAGELLRWVRGLDEGATPHLERCAACLTVARDLLLNLRGV